MTPLNILLADDDQVLRTSMGSLLRGYDTISHVVEVGNGLQAVEYASSYSFDVVLLDVDMPVLDGIGAAQQILREKPSTPVLMLTVFEHKGSLQRALDAGVKGFLTKDVSPDKIVDAVIAVYGGQTVLAPHPSELLVRSYLVTPDTSVGDPEFASRAQRLARRYWGVFNMLAQAQTTQKIAKELRLSDRTVRTYISEILTVLGCKTRAEVAVRALQSGVISLPHEEPGQ